jgi:uncharacterized short protein YbdD (DUF466 family)
VDVDAGSRLTNFVIPVGVTDYEEYREKIKKESSDERVLQIFMQACFK